MRLCGFLTCLGTQNGSEREESQAEYMGKSGFIEETCLTFARIQLDRNDSEL